MHWGTHCLHDLGGKTVESNHSLRFGCGGREGRERERMSRPFGGAEVWSGVEGLRRKSGNPRRSGSESPAGT
jgi:hypothetical protein